VARATFIDLLNALAVFVDTDIIYTSSKERDTSQNSCGTEVAEDLTFLLDMLKVHDVKEATTISSLAVTAL
jgi:hypothetical protein